MAEEQSPTVEIAPTIIVSNSSEGEHNEEPITPGNETHSNGDSELSGSELVGDPSPDNSENVAIAEIEAGRDVALATIHSDVERERIAVEAERIETENKGYDECREEISQLRGMVETIAEQLNSLIPPLVSEEMAMEELPIVPEPNLTEPSTQAPTLETMTEHSEENAEENPVVVEEVKTVRKFIAI